MHRVFVAVLVVLAFGPAVGGVAAVSSAPADEWTGDVAIGIQEEYDCEYPIEVVDGSGGTVTVEEEPDEVVVLGANTAQQLWEIGAAEKVTGMPLTPATAYLENREERTDVADEFGRPVHEEVVGLEPDLVLAASIISEEDVSQLRQAGLTVYHSPPETTLDDVYADIERIGQLVGEFDAAADVSAEMRGAVEAIEAATGAEPPVSVLYWMGGGWTAGANSVEDHMIRIAGGENIAHAADIEFYGEISEETIIAEDPEWLIISEFQEIPDELSETTAVQEDQIVRVDANFISQPGPRMIEPITSMATSFHSDVVDESTVENAQPAAASVCATVSDERDTDDDDSTDDTDVDETTTDADDTEVVDDGDDVDADDDGTGFTVAVVGVGLVTLVLTTFVARRIA